MAAATLIGVGNRFGGDDAVGLVVAERMRERAVPGLTVIESSGEGAALVECYTQAQSVVLVDSVQSGREPGYVHRYDAVNEPVPGQWLDKHSSHAFGVAQSLELARVLGKLPGRLVLIGVEGARFAQGESLSDEVAAAVPQVEQLVLTEVNNA